jgi:putative transposase
MSWGARHAGTAVGDLRDRIVAAIRDGRSMRGAAARLSVSPSSAIKLMAWFRATGSVAPARYGGHRRPVLLPHDEQPRLGLPRDRE